MESEVSKDFPLPFRDRLVEFNSDLIESHPKDNGNYRFLIIYFYRIVIFILLKIDVLEDGLNDTLFRGLGIRNSFNIRNLVVHILKS